MSYIVKTMRAPIDWSQIPTFSMNCYPWNCTYQPNTYGKMCFVPNEGFHLLLTCEETDPLAVFTVPNEPVFRDSCMEAFINFFPQAKDSGYVNFEMNSKGTLLSQYGPTGEERTFLLDKGLTPPVPLATVDSTSWQVALFIPLSLIESIYGKATFESGDMLHGNFYKCGDGTSIPHYGCWNPISFERPSFHRPEFFGELIIE